MDMNGMMRCRKCTWMDYDVFSRCAYGYDYDWRILNAADFGAYTSRKLFFGQFAKKCLPIAFPIATHAKSRTSEGEFFKDDTMKSCKPVCEVLDLNDEGLCQRSIKSRHYLINQHGE